MSLDHARSVRGPRARNITLAVVAPAQILVLLVFIRGEAYSAWVTDLSVALAGVAALSGVWLTLRGEPVAVSLVLVWMLGLQFYVAIPDALWGLGVGDQAGWVNVVFMHVSATDVPGGNATLLSLAVVAAGAYLALLIAWRRAREAEADDGLEPGIGLGGEALIRPQRNPRTTPLAQQRFGPAGAPEVVLLHGLAASRAVWRELVAELEGEGVRGLAPDLLGFGASRRIGTRFDLPAHVDAVAGLACEHGEAPLVVVAHSYGCAVAVALARSRPECVRALVLISPPVFRDADLARERLGRRGWLARQILRGSPAASFTCGAMCLARPAAGALAARVAREVPEEVARDSVQHSWPSYRQAVMTLLEDNPLPDAVDHPTHPTVLVLGDADSHTPAQDVLEHPHARVEVTLLKGDHLLPLSQAAAVARLVRDRICPAVQAPGRKYSDDDA